MESNNNDCVLVLEDRTAVKNEQGVGTLSVVLGIDEAGKLKASEVKKTQQASFLKFNEATQNVKELLKTGQTLPTATQQQKRSENKQQKARGRKMNL